MNFNKLALSVSCQSEPVLLLRSCPGEFVLSHRSRTHRNEYGIIIILYISSPQKYGHIALRVVPLPYRLLAHPANGKQPSSSSSLHIDFRRKASEKLRVTTTSWGKKFPLTSSPLPAYSLRDGKKAYVSLSFLLSCVREFPSVRNGIADFEFSFLTSSRNRFTISPFFPIMLPTSWKDTKKNELVLKC